MFNMLRKNLANALVTRRALDFYSKRPKKLPILRSRICNDMYMFWMLCYASFKCRKRVKIPYPLLLKVYIYIEKLYIYKKINLK